MSNFDILFCRNSYECPLWYQVWLYRVHKDTTLWTHLCDHFSECHLCLLRNPCDLLLNKSFCKCLLRSGSCVCKKQNKSCWWMKNKHRIAFLVLIRFWSTKSRHDICQFFYTSTFSKFYKFTPKKHVNRDILNLKYYIFCVSIYRIWIISQFLYTIC